VNKRISYEMGPSPSWIKRMRLRHLIHREGGIVDRTPLPSFPNVVMAGLRKFGKSSLFN
jgi:hypothetical protein